MFVSADSHNPYEPESPAPMKPVVALVMHSNGEGALVSKHYINDGGLGAGSLVSPYELKKIADQCIQAEVSRPVNEPALLSERLLMDTPEHIVWYSPSSVRDKLISARSGNVIRHRVVWPTLLFIVNKTRKSMTAYALPYKRRPKLTDPVYVAPLWNVYAANNFCLGSARLPDDLSPTGIVGMENCVFDSVFTHTNRADKEFRDTKSQKPYSKFWEDLAKSKVTVFPRKVLRPKNRTLADVLPS